MDDWKKFNETLLPEKEHFYSHLNMEDITDTNFTHAKRSCRDLEMKIQENIKKYQSNILLLTHVFQSFINMCLEIYQLDPAEFLSTAGLLWQIALKKG